MFVYNGKKFLFIIAITSHYVYFHSDVFNSDPIYVSIAYDVKRGAKLLINNNNIIHDYSYVINTDNKTINKNLFSIL